MKWIKICEALLSLKSIGGDGAVGESVAMGAVGKFGAFGAVGTPGYGGAFGNDDVPFWLENGWPVITVGFEFILIVSKLSWIGMVPIVIGRSRGSMLLQQLSILPAICVCKWSENSWKLQHHQNHINPISLTRIV